MELKKPMKKQQKFRFTVYFHQLPPLVRTARELSSKARELSSKACELSSKARELSSKARELSS